MTGNRLEEMTNSVCLIENDMLLGSYSPYVGLVLSARIWEFISRSGDATTQGLFPDEILSETRFTTGEGASFMSVEEISARLSSISGTQSSFGSVSSNGLFKVCC